MITRLIHLGAWIVQHPQETAGYALLAWAVATVLAGIYFWWQARQAIPPCASGLRRERTRIR
jgi:hypothetical protein